MPLTLTTVVETLRQETALQHSYAEKVLLPHLQQLNSREAYARMLSVLFGFYAPLEERIALQLDQHDLEDIHERRNSALILDDLHALSLFHANLPFCRHLPLVDSKASAFGVLYVLEGSTLGGRVICKLLSKNTHLQLQPEQLRFFDGYGEQTGPMWKHLTAVLNRRDDADTMVYAARHTFTSLTNWLQTSL